MEVNKVQNDSIQIQPSYYYEPNGVPVFEPAYDEFKDFYKFILSIESFGNKAGLVKVIPPKQWLDLNLTSSQKVQQFKIQKPLSQNFNCGGLPAGSHRQLNIETSKKYTVEEWAELCETKHRPPVYTDSGRMTLAEKKPKQKKEVDKVEDIPKYMTEYNNAHSKEYLEALERFYWRNLSFQTTMYGADLMGSLFTENNENKWDLSKLENLLSKVKVKVPGVTTPYLYFGMYKSTFAWHVEDMDLFSINYIHFGASKQWYVVPPSHKTRFERFASGLFYTESKKCSEFLRYLQNNRHKNCVISPSVILQQQIPVLKLVQNANEFVITFPNSYHQGYNTGFNCAESINFATPSWINHGRNAKFCDCVQDSVQMDVCGIFGLEPDEKKEKKRKLPNILEIPKSLKVMKHVKTRLPYPKCVLCPLGHSEEFPLVGTDIDEVFCHVECGAYVHETWTEIIKPFEPIAKVEETIEDADRQEVHEDLLAKEEVEDTVLGLISLSNSGSENINHFQEIGEPAIKKVRISDDSSVQEGMSTEKRMEGPSRIALAGELFRVHGISQIPLDRWKLKCSVCQYTGPPLKKLGACIQCTVGKCTRSYHVTCGLLAGLFMDLSETGTLISYCSTHDPVLKQQRKIEKENSINQRDLSEKFKVGTTVIVKYGGVKYEGVVLNVVKEKRGCDVQFEEQEEACFASWESLKVKEVKEIKVKPLVNYSDTKRKKNNDMLSLLTLFDGNIDSKSEHTELFAVNPQDNVDNPYLKGTENENLDGALSTDVTIRSENTMVIARYLEEPIKEKGIQNDLLLEIIPQPLEK